MFAQFILVAQTDGNIGRRMPSEATLGTWLAQRFGARGGDDAARPAVRAYLGYLKACGYLRWEEDGFYVVHDGLMPLPKAPPFRSAPVANPASPDGNPSTIRWLNTWPDEERLRRWAAEACDSGGGFDAEWFVGWLLRRGAPSSFEELTAAFEEADGNSQELMTVLRGLGVVADTKRYFPYGEPAPWRAAR